MGNLEAIEIVEGIYPDDHSFAELVEAWQHLIDTGLVWRLQGSYGRTAAQLIEEGYCTSPGRTG